MAFLLLIFFLSCVSLRSQELRLPDAWRFYQELSAERPGFLKLPLPPETMNAARPGLEDLRIYTDAGQEVPFYLEAPVPAHRRRIAVTHFTTQVEPNQTVIQFETGTTDLIEALGLETPAQQFLKAITISGSSNGSDWSVLLQSRPIFRRAGASLLQLTLPGGVWKFLRVTVDDSRDAPIPFQTFSLQVAPTDRNPPRPLNARIIERQESGQDTRVTLDLGAANVYLARLEIATPEPFFTRGVSLLITKLQGNELIEEEMGSGQISRIQVEGAAASDNRTIEMNRQITAQHLVIVFKNQDAPPLKVEAVRAWTRPFTTAFYAPGPGRVFLLTGNARTSAPRYDLNFVRAELSKVALSHVKLGPITPNPNYKEPPVLPGVAETGAKIDLSGWKHRKAVQLSSDGPQQLELDLETMSLCDESLRDLRLVQDDSQIPYLIEKTGSLKELSVQWSVTNDPARPAVSRWQIVLPYGSLPIRRVICQVPNPLFQRTVSIYEDRSVSRDGMERVLLGQATWTRKPDQTQNSFSVELSQPPGSNVLMIETDNGDNPPISIGAIKVLHSVSSLRFKANRTAPVYLYFGNPEAAFPRYDLAIVGEHLLKADKQIASLGKLEELKHGVNFASTHTPFLFWGVLAVVVLGLLFVISRLLPAPKTQ